MTTLDPIPPRQILAASPSKAPLAKVKSGLKVLVLAAATVLVSPLLLSYWLRARVLGPDRALEGSSQLLSLFPGLTGSYLRRAFLARVLKRCHSSADISFGTLFSQVGAILDENVYIGPSCHLGWVHLERDVLIAAGVHIPSGGQTHFFDDPHRPIREQGGARQMVRIGAGSWIGSGAIVLADVGPGCVVAAGAVVTKPLPGFVIAGGVPAKILRPRFPNAESLPEVTAE
jgi:acetyltransferase-like isoleucine patch superfamily enzyme